jgi:NAD(P)-dependent dehydrogenase (short-subunit alcohol dehydrogenase family)
MVEDADPEVEKGILAETALARWGTGDDVAGAAVFLASHDADFITGELLIVAGGRGMH